MSSVALDPLGRGLGAAAVIPSDKAHMPGLLVFFNYRTGKLLDHELTVGFHPDCVVFSEDGRHVLVANEGEFNDQASTPGSLSVVDVSALKSADEASVAVLKADTHDFQGVPLEGIRTTESDRPAAEAMEPEYVTALDDRAYVSLQENNALAVFDLKERRWLAVQSLGTLRQTIDADDKDGKADISHQVAGLPMPDTIRAFRSGDTVIVATANEGDARTDDSDRVRVNKARLDESIADLAADEKLGRLDISSVDGDADQDGDIDVPTVFGTRSFSLWNAATGGLVADTGSLEPLLLKLAPELHNSENGDPASKDSRSSKKGPEPEALAVGSVAGKPFVFVALERQNGILMFDVGDPAKPAFAAYVNTIEEKLVAPESLVFVPADKSPTGTALLIGGYELNGGGIGVFEVRP